MGKITKNTKLHFKRAPNTKAGKYSQFVSVNKRKPMTKKQAVKLAQVISQEDRTRNRVSAIKRGSGYTVRIIY